MKGNLSETFVKVSADWYRSILRDRIKVYTVKGFRHFFCLIIWNYRTIFSCWCSRAVITNFEFKNEMLSKWEHVTRSEISMVSDTKKNPLTWTKANFPWIWPKFNTKPANSNYFLTPHLIHPHKSRWLTWLTSIKKVGYIASLQVCELGRRECYSYRLILICYVFIPVRKM